MEKMPEFETDLERLAWLARNRPRQTFNSAWRGVALAAAVIGISTAVYSCGAKSAHAFLSINEATYDMQVLQHAEALLQTKAQLEMLMGLGLNNSPEIMARITKINGLLGKIENVLGYDPATILGQVQDRYPMQSGGAVSLPEAVERQREWDAARYGALSESHRVQAEVSAGIPAATARDAATLAEAISSPGLRASQDAGNQLSLSVAEELRNSQMLQIASMRAIEARELEEAAQGAKADGTLCGFLSSATYTSRACHGSD